MKIKFKGGMVLEISLDEEIDAEEFETKISIARTMVNCGLKQDKVLNSMEEEPSKSRETGKVHSKKIDIIDYNALGKKINEMREIGKTDHEIMELLGKYPTWISCISKTHRQILNRREWEKERMKMMKGGEFNGSDNATREEDGTREGKKESTA